MAFEGQDCVYPLHLDISSKNVNHDIRVLLGATVGTIRDVAFQKKCKELDAVNELAARASGLFIWAATVAKFVCAFPVISRLQALLAMEIPRDATEALTTLYRTALDLSFLNQVSMQILKVCTNRSRCYVGDPDTSGDDRGCP